MKNFSIIKSIIVTATTISVAALTYAEDYELKGHAFGYVGIASAQETNGGGGSRDVYGFTFGAAYIHPLSKAFGMGLSFTNWSLDGFSQSSIGLEFDFKSSSNADIYVTLGQGVKFGYRQYRISEEAAGPKGQRPFFSFEVIAPHKDQVQSLFTVNYGIRF